MDDYVRIKTKANNGNNLSEKETEKLADYSLRMTYKPGEEKRVEAERLIKEYDENKKLLTEEIQTNKSILVTLKKEVEALSKSRSGHPVKYQFEKILSKYKIVYKQHFTMTLTGENCHRWLVNHEDILEELRTVLYDGLEIEGEGTVTKSCIEKNKLKDEIDTLIYQMMDLMSLFDYIVSVMREQRYHNDDECQIFENACICFGDKWRQYGLSVTPKLHQVEIHVVDFMKKYRRLFAEDSIERRHQTNNHHSRVLACIHRWHEKILIREKRISVEKYNSKVAESISITEIKTKRCLDQFHIDKKRAKKLAGDLVKSENRKAVSSKFK